MPDLKTIRAEQLGGISQDRVAKQLDLTTWTYGQWEARRPCPHDKMLRMALAWLAKHGEELPPEFRGDEQA